MQQINEDQVSATQGSVLRCVMRDAAGLLRRNDHLIRSVIVYLFCVLALFALSFAHSLILFLRVLCTPVGATLLTVSGYAFGALLFFVLILPLFAGRIRMAGRIAAEGTPQKKELFYYFGSRRLWWRGVRIGLLAPLSVLIPPFFSALALAIGNEELSLSRSLALSVGRVPFWRVLGFWGHVLCRLLLGVVTLGLFWLLYGAHHGAVSYFLLVMRKEEAQIEHAS